MSGGLSGGKNLPCVPKLIVQYEKTRYFLNFCLRRSFSGGNPPNPPFVPKFTVQYGNTRGYELWSNSCELWKKTFYDCIENPKWIKVHFSDNLKVDQSSFWTLDVKIIRKYASQTKFISHVHFRKFIIQHVIWSPPHTLLDQSSYPLIPGFFESIRDIG